MPWREIEIAKWPEFVTHADVALNSTSPLTPAFVFRGHADHAFRLKPTLARHLEGASNAEAILHEHRLVSAFRSQAHLQVASQFLSEDRNPWSLVRAWSLMRHHGAPTRLLDWTASPYVALYFAIVDRWDSDGQVICMMPGAIENRIREHAPPRSERGEDGVSLLDGDDDPPRLFFVSPAVRSDRMVAQQGYFTLMTRPLAEQDEAIAAACGGHNETGNLAAVRIRVPAILKPEFLFRLRLMNVTGASLFPGLDGFGRDLDEVTRIQSELHKRKSPLMKKLTIDQMERFQAGKV